MQERLWFLNELFPENLAYNIPSGYRLRGPLDTASLQRALTEVLRRHDVLRSVYTEQDGAPVQTAGGPDTIELPVVDVPGDDDAERLRHAAELARAVGRVPFDLGAGPLFRAELLRLGPDDHVLVLAFHHIVSDHWSLGIILRETSSLYEAYLSGLGSPLPLPGLQYADFAVWHRDRLANGVVEDQEPYWRKQLAGLTPTHLPGDKDWPEVQTFDGTRIRLHLPAAQTAQLEALAAEHDATLFMVLSAAVTVLLAARTGRPDVSFSSVAANRRRPEFEDMVGFFATTLMLRIDAGEAASYTEVLLRTREVTLAAYENQDVPYENLVRILTQDRDLRQMPLGGVVMTFLNVPEVALRLPAVTVEDFPFDPGTAKFGVDIVFAHSPNGLAIDLDFRNDLYSPAAMQAFGDELVTVLAAFGAAPDALPDALPDAQPVPGDGDRAASPLRPRDPAPDTGSDTGSDSGSDSEIRTRVAAVWANLLDVDEVGADDNFFGLGGHSMLATRMLTGIREEFGIRLRVRTVFDNPTLSAFSTAVAEAMGS